jgi:hypothetical protein
LIEVTLRDVNLHEKLFLVFVLLVDYVIPVDVREEGVIPDRLDASYVAETFVGILLEEALDQI